MTPYAATSGSSGCPSTGPSRSGRCSPRRPTRKPPAASATASTPARSRSSPPRPTPPGASTERRALAGLDQRIGGRYAMAPTPPGEPSEYLRPHPKPAGRPDQLFSDDAAGLIHQASRGYPRAVNRLAAAALLATYTTHKTIADTTAARAAITEANDQ